MSQVRMRQLNEFIIFIFFQLEQTEKQRKEHVGEPCSLVCNNLPKIDSR